MTKKSKGERRDEGRSPQFDGSKPLNNARHERFAQLLAEGKSADAAYAGAGYRPHRSNPARMSGKERIRARVAAIQTAGAARAEITVERVAAELAKVAFASIGAVVERWGAEGVTLKDSALISDNDKAAVAEISESRLRGERTVRVKLHNKLDALEKLGKFLGMFRYRVEHSGPDSAPIAVEPSHYMGIELAVATPDQLDLMARLRSMEIEREQRAAHATLSHQD